MLGFVAAEIGRISKSQRTDLTLIGSVSSVCSAVHLEAVRMRKPFATLSAFERLLSTVDPKVCLQAVGLGEGGSTLVTLKGSVTSVFSHVDRQLP